jgi:uncharacterized protein with HEPN domain
VLDTVERLRDAAPRAFAELPVVLAYRFRDLLVHGYTRVDDRRVVEILQTRRDDLQEFRVSSARAVVRVPEDGTPA